MIANKSFLKNGTAESSTMQKSTPLLSALFFFYFFFPLCSIFNFLKFIELRHRSTRRRRKVPSTQTVLFFIFEKIKILCSSCFLFYFYKIISLNIFLFFSIHPESNRAIFRMHLCCRHAHTVLYWLERYKRQRVCAVQIALFPLCTTSNKQRHGSLIDVAWCCGASHASRPSNSSISIEQSRPTFLRICRFLRQKLTANAFLRAFFALVKKIFSFENPPLVSRGHPAISAHAVFNFVEAKWEVGQTLMGCFWSGGGRLLHTKIWGERPAGVLGGPALFLSDPSCHCRVFWDIWCLSTPFIFNEEICGTLQNIFWGL